MHPATGSPLSPHHKPDNPNQPRKFRRNRALDLARRGRLHLSTADPVSSPKKCAGVVRKLYSCMRRAGLVDLCAFPALITLDEPEGPIWRYREDHIVSQLSLAETAAWQAARVAAAEEGLLMQAHALHCAVASKQ